MLTKIWNFFFHSHQWEIHKEEQIIRQKSFTNEKGVVGVLYVLKCSKCGEIKFKRVMANDY